MFTIIGGDGNEYGPVTPAQIRAWIAAGRANLETQAKAEGTAEWRRLGEFPEFGASEPPPVIVSNDVALGDRGARLLAKLLDEVLALACALPGAALLGFGFLKDLVASRDSAQLSEMDLAGNTAGLGVLALGVLALAVVQIWMISTRGQSIGKRVFGVRIVRDLDGALPGFVHGWLLRSFVPGLIGMIPLGGGFLFALVDVCFIFRRDRRCIHDFIAGTRVVKA